MDFVGGNDGSITPDPDTEFDQEHIDRTLAAMQFFRGNAEHLERFTRRVQELGRDGSDTVITLLNVDDPKGGILANILMPGHDWQQYRDAGEIPVARGLAGKDGIPEFLEGVGYADAAVELSATNALKVVVLDSGVALVLEVKFGV